jgi:hypothetical protein
MDLTVLFEPKIDLAHIAGILDGLGHAGRLDTIRAWGKAELTAVFDAAQGFSAIDLDHFVPKSVGPLTEVIHHGKTSLAVFTHFEHHFCRPGSDTEPSVLWGYNHHDLQMWTGPGYFVAHAAETAGEVLLDYTQTPKNLGPALGVAPTEPGGWPPVMSNAARLGRFVFEGTIDTVRGVSKHVSIGRARRGKNWMDAWFVLCREDAG